MVQKLYCAYIGDRFHEDRKRNVVLKTLLRNVNHSILAGNFETGQIEEEGGEETRIFKVIMSQSQDKE